MTWPTVSVRLLSSSKLWWIRLLRVDYANSGFSNGERSMGVANRDWFEIYQSSNGMSLRNVLLIFHASSRASVL